MFILLFVYLFIYLFIIFFIFYYYYFFPPFFLSFSFQETEHYLRQNNAIDIYEEYFSCSESTPIASETPYAKTISILRDPNDLKRAVTHISWYPDGASRLAAAYSMIEFQKSLKEVSLESYVWELGKSASPITGPYQMYAAAVKILSNTSGKLLSILLWIYCIIL